MYTNDGNGDGSYCHGGMARTDARRSEIKFLSLLIFVYCIVLQSITLLLHIMAYRFCARQYHNHSHSHTIVSDCGWIRLHEIPSKTKRMIHAQIIILWCITSVPRSYLQQVSHTVFYSTYDNMSDFVRRGEIVLGPTVRY